VSGQRWPFKSFNTHLLDGRGLSGSGASGERVHHAGGSGEGPLEVSNGGLTEDMKLENLGVVHRLKGHDGLNEKLKRKNISVMSQDR
jgi:hypothetical protein